MCRGKNRLQRRTWLTAAQAASADQSGQPWDPSAGAAAAWHRNLAARAGGLLRVGPADRAIKPLPKCWRRLSTALRVGAGTWQCCAPAKAGASSLIAIDSNVQAPIAQLMAKNLLCLFPAVCAAHPKLQSRKEPLGGFIAALAPTLGPPSSPLKLAKMLSRFSRPMQGTQPWLAALGCLGAAALAQGALRGFAIASGPQQTVRTRFWCSTVFLSGLWHCLAPNCFCAGLPHTQEAFCAGGSTGVQAWQVAVAVLPAA